MTSASSFIAQGLTETLPPIARLALAYAPDPARMPTLALLALDARLAGLLRHSREPMLAQLRLAWWRETLGQDAAAWPEGEPLLAALRSWSNAHAPLVALVDGWEMLTGTAPLPADALAGMAEGRAAAFSGLAGVLGFAAQAEDTRAVARRWARADLAMRLGHPQEREAALALYRSEMARPPRLPRPLRPVAVLSALARRRLEKGTEAAATSPAAVLTALRVGLIGR
ncbi:hypothetical protein [Novosphingobium colocasiae]|uniref:Phytoene synthase n=1 Tax=Novosphingobium colocasiae TaxID=1256513 RepID=A0A918UDL8_9SPHN|nr:hypothetical protein [Novosphingobium colocasiae]GGY97303.1 hypothetical protein GCM10011614_10380 [Novosphingobium colocasiae]